MKKNFNITYIVAASLGLITIIVILGVVFIANSTTSAANSNSVQTTTNNSVNATTLIDSNITFKDGKYSSGANYFVRGHMESITVSITLAKNVIVSVENQESGTNSVSAQYQDAFEGLYKDSVINKNITSVNLSRVAGASDTTNAFMQAFQKIENNAKA